VNLSPVRIAALVLVTVLLASCSTVKEILPFGEKENTELSRKPANATEYACEGGKRFYVRTLDANAVWLIAPDREIRLEKLAGAEGTRYGVGRTVLEISGPDAMLTDPPTQFAGCRNAGAKKP
jgi:membrane-bound inhibitor of C-type lysozyme